ncbi:MAG: hypothetical protein AAFO04_21850 [Cyanobacteria bacterium J06592_8]
MAIKSSGTIINSNRPTSKRAIAKLVECSPSTLYQWMERRHIHPRKKSTR